MTIARERLDLMRAELERPWPTDGFDLMGALHDYSNERENVRFHSIADEIGACVEDCCDGDEGTHIVEAAEKEDFILQHFDALKHRLAGAEGFALELLAEVVPGRETMANTTHEHRWREVGVSSGRRIRGPRHVECETCGATGVVGFGWHVREDAKPKRPPRAPRPGTDVAPAGEPREFVDAALAPGEAGAKDPERLPSGKAPRGEEPSDRDPLAVLVDAERVRLKDGRRAPPVAPIHESPAPVAGAYVDVVSKPRLPDRWGDEKGRFTLGEGLARNSFSKRHVAP